MPTIAARSNGSFTATATPITEPSARSTSDNLDNLPQVDPSILTTGRLLCVRRIDPQPWGGLHAHVVLLVRAGLIVSACVPCDRAALFDFARFRREALAKNVFVPSGTTPAEWDAMVAEAIVNPDGMGVSW